jgi:hypothetical protein
MQPRTHSTAVAIHAVFAPVLKQAEFLVRALESRRAVQTEMENLAGLLETLPLASSEFGLACTRLSNAQRYIDSAEHGAARWELNAMVRQLRAQAYAETKEPRRRLRS